MNRVPAADDLRSNMVRGGTPKETELTAREREICKTIGPALRERDHLVGIDVIDGYLTEINVTSPTGIRAIKSFGGADMAAMICDRIEAQRGVGPSAADAIALQTAPCSRIFLDAAVPPVMIPVVCPFAPYRARRLSVG